MVTGSWWHNTTDTSLPIASDIGPLDGSGSSPVAQTPGEPGGGVPANGPKAWNSPNHQRDGQNVGFADGHDEFVRRADIGQNSDNIFTQNGTNVAGSTITINAPITSTAGGLTIDAAADTI